MAEKSCNLHKAQLFDLFTDITGFHTGWPSAVSYLVALRLWASWNVKPYILTHSLTLVSM